MTVDRQPQAPARACNSFLAFFDSEREFTVVGASAGLEAPKQRFELRKNRNDRPGPGLAAEGRELASIKVNVEPRQRAGFFLPQARQTDELHEIGAVLGVVRETLSADLAHNLLELLPRRRQPDWLLPLENTSNAPRGSQR